MANYFDRFDEAPSGNYFDQFDDPEPSPSIGERAAGLGLSIASGAMHATKAPADLVNVVAPNRVTQGISDFFQRGIDAAREVAPESIQRERAQPILSRGADGSLDFQFPNATQITDVLAESAPQIPFLLAGGGALARGAQALGAGKLASQAIGYGGANAALVAPAAGDEVQRQAIAEGQSLERARAAQLTAAGLMAPISAITGGAGLGLAAKLGAGRGLLSGAARGFAADAPFEGIEEGAESAVQDIALGQEIDPIRAGSAAALGTIAGGLPGAAVGAVEGKSGPAPPRDPIDPSKPAGPITRAALAAAPIVPQNDPAQDIAAQRTGMEADARAAKLYAERDEEEARRQRAFDAANTVVGEGEDITLETPPGKQAKFDAQIKAGNQPPPPSGGAIVGTARPSELTPQERKVYDDLVGAREQRAAQQRQALSQQQEVRAPDGNPFKTVPGANAARKKLETPEAFEVKRLDKGQFVLARKPDGSTPAGLAQPGGDRPGADVGGSPAVPQVQQRAVAGSAGAAAAGTVASGQPPVAVGSPQPEPASALTETPDARLTDPVRSGTDGQAAAQDAGLSRTYREKARELSGNPDNFNADLAKELFPEYAASKDSRRDQSDGVQKRASQVRDEAFNERLKEPAQPGERVTFMAGGTGSGKTSATPASGIVYDTTLANADSAIEKIRRVRESGREVRVNYTFTDPVIALKRAIGRQKESGRAVRLKDHAETHRGSNESVRRIAEVFKDDPGVSVTPRDNSGASPIELKAPPTFDYNGIDEKLRQTLDAERAAGAIDERAYQAFAGPGTQPDGQAGVRLAGPSGTRRGRVDEEPRADETPGVLASPAAAPVQNADSRSTTPVAESQAPGIDPGDGGVANAQGGAAPQSATGTARPAAIRRDDGEPFPTAPAAGAARKALPDADQYEVAKVAPRQFELRRKPLPETGASAAPPKVEIAESDGNRAIRNDRGYTELVEVDASRFLRDFEKTTGAPAGTVSARMDALRKVEGPLNDYPRAGIREGRPSIEDGRNRIALAAERGQSIDVAVTPEQTADFRQAFGRPAQTTAVPTTQAPAPDVPRGTSVPEEALDYNLPKNTRIGKAEDLAALYENARTSPSPKKDAIRYATVSVERAADIRTKTGVDVAGYRHVLDNFAARKILNDHGSAETETPRGQEPITKEDIAKVPDIVENYDLVEAAGKDSAGNDLVRYTKRYNGSTYFVEETRTGRRELAAKTMWKTRSRVPLDVLSPQPEGRTPEATRGNLPADSVGARVQQVQGTAPVVAAAPLAPENLPRGTPAPGVPSAAPATVNDPLMVLQTPAPIIPKGSSRTVVTAKGREVDTAFDLVDASDLVVSNDQGGRTNPNYPAYLQPRDRSSASSQTQIARIASSLRPELLADSGKASDGAPIVGDDNVVESGNGRIAAISSAYKQNQAQGYRDYIRANAAQFGLTPEQVDGLKQPVLVRRRATPMNEAERAEFAKEANQADIAALSPREQARSDAQRISDEDISAFRPDESGNVLARSNDDFLRAFSQRIGANEAGGLTTADGRWTKQMADRVQAAVFAKAYDDDRLTQLFAEEADPEVKSILTALSQAAPAFAKARSVTGGLADLDVVAPLVEAIETVRSARRSGTRIDEALAQADAFTQRNPDADKLVRVLDQYKRSPRRIGDMLTSMAQAIEAAQLASRTQALFADVPNISRGSVIDAAIERLRSQDARPQQQTSLGLGPGFRTQADAQREANQSAESGQTAPVRDRAGEQAGSGRAAAGDAGVETPSQNNTEDSGAELTYNRRNRIRTGIKWSDIADKNETLRVSETTKPNVYPRPDYEALIAEGVQPIAAHIVKQVYDAIAPKPATRAVPTDADLKTYIDSVNRIMAGALAWAKDKQAVGKWAAARATRSVSDVDRDALSQAKTLLEYVYPGDWRDFRPEVIVAGGNKILSVLQPRSAEARRAAEAIKDGWPAKQEAWQKSFEIREAPAGTVITNKQTGERKPIADAMFFIAGKHSLGRNVGGGLYSTREEATAKARELTKRKGKGTISDKGISVESARREGASHRLEGEDISSDRLQEAFGFKGVNFGTWLKGDSNRAERQLHLNHAYDSFMDLAGILNVPPKAMSLNGMLGLAIGAQGGGTAAAHFVPGVNEINLTRTSGAGSLAHEWGHALDHYFATQAGLTRQKQPFLTEHVVTGKALNPDLRPEIGERFGAIVTAMNKKPESSEQVAARVEAYKANAKRNVTGWLNSIKRDFLAEKVDDQVFESFAERIRRMDLGEGKVAIGNVSLSPVVDELRAAYKAATGRIYPLDQSKALQANLDRYAYLISTEAAQKIHQPQVVGTDYAANASKLDKGKSGKLYWSTNLEKFARAFDAYVSDTLEARATKNTYLSHAGRSGDTVPTGSERKAINAAFDALIGELKTREEGGKVALFALGDGSSAGSYATAIRGVLDRAFGTRGIQNLIDSGILRIVPSVYDLPRGLRDEALAEGGRVKGLYDRDNKVAYLVSSNLLPNEAVKVLLHEVGEHYGLKTMLGDDGYARLIEETKRLAKFNPVVKDAYATVKRLYANVDESSEQFWREVIAKSAEQPAILKQPWFKNLILAIRRFLFTSRLVPVSIKDRIAITDQDIAGMVAASLRSTMRGARPRQEAPTGEPAMAAIGDPERIGNTDKEGVWGLPSKLRNGATHVAVRITQEGRRFFFGDSAGTARVAAAEFDRGPDQGERVSESARVLREAGGTAADRPGMDAAGNRERARLVSEALSFFPARIKQNSGAFKATPDAQGRCFEGSSQVAADGFGDMLLGLRTQQGAAPYWHAVVRFPDGTIFDPTAATAFKPGVYEKLGFEIKESLSPEEVRNFAADHGRDFSFPAPHNLGLAGFDESREAAGGEPPDFALDDAIPQRAGSRASWDAPEPSRIDDMLYSLQDKQIDLRRVVQAVQKTSGALDDQIDPYLAEELYHGRAAKNTQDFIDGELKPLLTEMASKSITLDALQEYLHARHAEEANIAIAKRNPEIPDGGSGLKTEDARTYLSSLDKTKRAQFDGAAKRVDSIIAETRKTLVGYGLESQVTVDTWAGAYQHYIPLQREDMEGGPGIGQGFSVRGPATKMRTGSTRKVVDILANVALQRERAIVRGEKNRVANALIGLAEANPNAEFWKVDRPPTIKTVSERTGLVETRIDPLYKSRENVVVARVPTADGIKERSVVFNETDPRAMRMAASIKNLDMDQLGTVLGLSAKVTRYLASVNTQYNPVFGVVNLVRDAQAAMFNLSTTPIADKKAEVAANLLSALKGIYSDARKVRSGGQATSAWAREWEEFQKVGGQTGYRDMFRTSNDRAEAIEAELKRAAKGDPLKPGRAVFDWLSDYNLAMENSVRLAAYKAAKDTGLSKERAASIAKNLTVNFNRKGQVAQQAGALYAFFNASAQGTARLAETLTGPAGRKIITGGLVLGVVQALALAAAGFDDDPPEFVRERNLLIPLGDKKYLSIPMPLGLHVIPSTSRIVTELALSGFENAPKRAVDLIGLFADAFNPMGNAGVSLQTIAPTVIDPLAALSENKDFAGRPIYREDFSSLNPTPGFTRAKDTATLIGIAASKSLNWITGGSEFTPGGISPTPDQIDYLLEQVTGGVGREYSKAEQSMSSLITGEDLPPYKVPLAGRFFGNAGGQASESTAFYSNIRRINGHEGEIKGRARNGESPTEYIRENPEARLVMLANRAERSVRELRGLKHRAVENDAPAALIQMYDRQITEQMRLLNVRVRALKEAA